LIETIDNLKKLIKNKNTCLFLDISENIYIDGDKNSLSVMFKNIIEHSIKYTPENGSITISLLNNGSMKKYSSDLSEQTKRIKTAVDLVYLLSNG
jgi:signal transduction histidine kinase